MTQTATPNPPTDARPAPATVSPAAPGAAQTAGNPTPATPIPMGGPLPLGITLALTGLVGFAACKLALRHHWNTVKRKDNLTASAVIWLDVILRLVSYVCITLLALGLFVLVMKLLGRI